MCSASDAASPALFPLAGFDPTKDDVYDKFKPISNRTIQLWELKETAAVAGTTKLSLDFLNGSGIDNDKKVVMLFVELLKEDSRAIFTAASAASKAADYLCSFSEKSLSDQIAGMIKAPTD